MITEVGDAEPFWQLADDTENNDNGRTRNDIRIVTRNDDKPNAKKLGLTRKP